MAAARSSKPAGEPEASSEAVAQEVQRVADKAEEKGLLGVEVDPTPNENYTFAGQAAGKPTPETDDETAAEARKASHG